MNKQQQRKHSKLLSLVLRHQPGFIGIRLEPAGWCKVDELLAALARKGQTLKATQLKFIVAQNDKQRFEFSSCQTKIRARQGHSLPVELGYQNEEPPATLYHGTYENALPLILERGLLKMQRHAVHLHTSKEIAISVGQRHGTEALLAIDAKAMNATGLKFQRTQNGVWLTDHVPPQFIRLLQS